MKFYRSTGTSLSVIATILALSTAIARADDAKSADAQKAKATTEANDAQGNTLPDLVITGEKTEKSAMDSAFSVTVFTSDDIKYRAGIDTLNDAIASVPTFITSETSNLAPAVRGLDGTGPSQGADAFFAGTRPRLNYMLDGRTLSYNETIFSDSMLWDIDSVEIYTGPQSTLQGRNSIAGAIVAKTKNPTWDFEGADRVALGSYNQQEYSGVVSGPIIDKQVAIRLSADVREKDSYVDFMGYPEDTDPGKYQNMSLRGKILIEPASIPDLSALLTLNHITAAAPQTNSVSRPFEDHVASYPFMPSFGTRTDGAILDVDYKLSDAWSLSSVLTGTDLRVRRWALAGDGNAEITAHEFAFEPLAKFAYSGINGFVGLHLFRNNQDEVIDLFGGGRFEDRTETAALFAEATVKTTDYLDVTLGGRVERETRDRTGYDFVFVTNFHETYEEFLPKATVAWHVNEDFTLGGTVSRGYNGGGAGFTYDAPFTAYTYKPEYVWNYEIFTRNSFNDNRIELTSNIFYNEYKDLQLPFDLNPSPVIWAYVVRNANEAQTYGAEIGVRALVIEDLTAFANLGLLHTEVTKYPGSGVEGNSLARSPAFALNFGGQYMIDSFDLSLDARFTDAYHSEVVHMARGKTDAYWIANAEAGYSLKNARVFATVKNIFDETAPVLLSPGATPADDVANMTDPRTVTVGIDFDF